MLQLMYVDSGHFTQPELSLQWSDSQEIKSVSFCISGSKCICKVYKGHTSGSFQRNDWPFPSYCNRAPGLAPANLGMVQKYFVEEIFFQNKLGGARCGAIGNLCN